MKNATSAFTISMSSMNKTPRDRTAWSAQWICNPVKGEGIYYAWFYKSFELEERPVSSVIRITADRRYRLFINGDVIGDGSAPSGSHYWAYDSIAVQAGLQVGKNERS